MNLNHSIAKKIISTTLAAALLAVPALSGSRAITADALTSNPPIVAKSEEYCTGIYLTTTKVNVRSGAGVACELLGSIPKSTRVSIIDIDGNWGYVVTETLSGWISMNYTKLIRADSEYSVGTYSCTVSKLNVRSGPGTSYTPVGMLDLDRKVVVRDLNGEWGYINEDDISGWINMSMMYFESESMQKYATGTYNVIPVQLNMRMGKSSNYDVAMPLFAGDSLSITKVNGDWGFTIKDNVAGWVNMEYMEYVSPTITTKQIVRNNEIKEGATVQVKMDAPAYSGGTLPSWMYNDKFEVLTINDDKVTIGKNGKFSAYVNIESLILLDNLFCNGMGAVYSYGMDISKWQGANLDWGQIAASGIEFVILRVGTSYGLDPQFEKNYADAKAMGLDVGVYFYTYSDTSNAAIEDAQKCIKWLKGKTLEYPVYFDIEDPEKQANLSMKKNTEIATSFIDTMFASNWYSGVYSSVSWYGSRLNYGELGAKFDIWVARYSDGTEYDHCEYGSMYGMYQYTETGSIKGITGNVDLNVAYKDYPSIIKNGGYSGHESSFHANRGFIFYGDASGDDAVSMEDVTLLQQSIAGLAEIDAKYQGLADVNDDGKRNLEDVVLMQQYIADIIYLFPAEQ